MKNTITLYLLLVTFFLNSCGKNKMKTEEKIVKTAVGWDKTNIVINHFFGLTNLNWGWMLTDDKNNVLLENVTKIDTSINERVVGYCAQSKDVDDGHIINESWFLIVGKKLNTFQTEEELRSYLKKIKKDFKYNFVDL